MSLASVRPVRRNWTTRRRALGGLVWTIVRTDFKVRYHGTIGGFLWAILKPLAMFAVLWSVFSLVFAEEPEYRFRLLIGLFLYDFFVEASKTALVALRSKSYLLTKTRSPAWILVVTSTSNGAITFVLLAAVVVVALAVSGRAPSARDILLFGLYWLWLLWIVAGFALAASVLFLRYRDLNQVWDVVTQAGFFVAPIVYPLGILPHRVHFYLYMWPPTPAIMFARAVLLDHAPPTLTAHLYMLAEGAIVMGIGVAVYWRLRPRAAEYL